MNLGILLWNKCNAKCSHCAVNSGPDEGTVLSDAQIFKLIDGCFVDSRRPHIGFSGGEAFLYFDRLCRIVEYAASGGALVSVNSNCAWAIDAGRAVKRLNRLKNLGLSQIVVSTDEFHEKYIPAERVINVIRACKIIHLEVELQFVATKSSTRLADFLGRFGDDMLNVKSREIPCHPTGRALHEIDDDDILREPGVPQGLCPSAILSIAADGRVIPCCNTAGHLKALQIGTADQPISDLQTIFRSSAVMNVMTADGPKALVPAAQAGGFKVDGRGYVDQCHLCHEIFKHPGAARAAKEFAAAYMADRLYRELFVDALAPRAVRETAE